MTAEPELLKQRHNANNMSFRDLTRIFEDILRSRSGDDKNAALFSQKLFDIIRGQSMYPIIRLVVPAADRRVYGLKESKIAKAYCDMLSLNKETSADYQKLINWKDPISDNGYRFSGSSSSTSAGDLPSAIEDALRDRIYIDDATAAPTVGDVNSILDLLASSKDKVNIFQLKVLNRFTASEQKWLVRIVLGEMKYNYDVKKMMKGYSDDALKRFNMTSSLEMVMEETLTRPVTEMGIEMFSTFQVMLAARHSSGSSQLVGAEELMKGKPFVMDVKLDGERLVVHCERGNGVCCFTRRGNDYSDTYAPLMRTIGENVSVHKCVLDGEVVGWERAAACRTKFGQNRPIADKERDAMESDPYCWRDKLGHWLIFFAFDIVYLDDDRSSEIISAALAEAEAEGYECASGLSPAAKGDITHLPLIVRRKILARIFTPVDCVLEMVQHRTVGHAVVDRQERLVLIEAYFDEISRSGEEGLVIKNLTTEYVLGDDSRRFRHWVKLKPEYGDNFDEFDLVVLGANYGTGARRGGGEISTFVVGVKRSAESDISDYNNFLIFGRVGTGYTQLQLEEFRERVGCNAIVVDPANPPDHLKKHWKALNSSNRPDVWFPPDKSAVLQLMCGEVIRSNDLEVGFTMRFPRVKHFRYDKAYHEIMCIDDVMEAFYSPKQRQSSAGVDEVGGAEGVQPEKRREKRHYGESKKRKKVYVDSQFSASATLGPVQADADWFENMTFCLLSNQRFEYCDHCDDGGGGAVATMQRVEYKMVDLQHLVLLKGGRVSANPPLWTAPSQDEEESYILVAAESEADGPDSRGYSFPFAVKQYLQSGRYNMIDFSYIIDCIKANRKLEIRGSYFYTASHRAMSSGGHVARSDMWGLPTSEPVMAVDVRRSLQSAFSSRVDVLQRHAADQPALKRATTAKAKAKQAEEESPLLPFDKQRLKDMLREKQRLDALGWRDIAAQLAESESLLLSGPFHTCFSNRCVLYIDLFADFGPTVAKAGFDELTRLHLVQCDFLSLRLLACRLQLHGAALSRSLHAGVTHIVVCEEDLSRVQALRARARELRLLPQNVFEKKMCRAIWAEAIIAGGFRGPYDYEEVHYERDDAV